MGDRKCCAVFINVMNSCVRNLKFLQQMHLDADDYDFNCFCHFKMFSRKQTLVGFTIFSK